MNNRGEIILFVVFGLATLIGTAILAVKEAENPSPPAMDIQSIVERSIRDYGK